MPILCACGNKITFSKNKNKRFKKCSICRVKQVNIIKTVLHALQNGKCAICEKEISLTESHLDHCHKLGYVRGLLCPNCNFGLGWFKDDKNILNKAIFYLAKMYKLKYENIIFEE